MANEVEIVVTASNHTAAGFAAARAQARAEGEKAGAEYVRGADGRLRDKRGRFVIDADNAPAERKIGETERSRRRLDGKRASVSVDANVANALAKIASVVAALSALGVAGVGAVAGLGAVGGAGLGAMASGFLGIGKAVGELGKTASGGGGGASRAADQVRAANQAVERSEHDLQIAQRESRQAQADLTAARADAKRQLEDLQQQTEDMALAQKRATLDVEQAQQDLAKTLSDPRSTDLQRRSAQLAFEEAKQHQKDLGTAAQRLAQEKAEADKKGVEGSDQVVEAQQRMADATWRVHEAQVALADAQRKTGESAGAAGGGVDTLAQAMAKLSPAGQAFARFLRGFIDGPLKEFRFAGQSTLLPGIQRGMESLVPVMQKITPAWRDFNEALGKAIGGMIEFGGKLSGPFLKFAAAALQGLAPLGPVLDKFADGFSKMTDKVIADGSLEGAMNGVVEAVDAVLQVLLDLIPPGLDLAKDVLPPLADAFKELGPFVAALAKAIMPALVAILKELTPILQELTEFMVQHPKLAAGMVLGFTAVALAINLISSPASAILILLGILVAQIIYCYQRFETFRRIVDGVLRGVRDSFVAFLGSVLWVFGKVLDGAAWAFGWMPGIGPKLQAAARHFHAFANTVIADLAGIPEVKYVNVVALVNGRRQSIARAVGSANDREGRYAARAAGGIVGQAASGGIRSGLTLVGENGPELIDAAPGSRVHTAADTSRAMTGGSGGGRVDVVFSSDGSRVGDFLLELVRHSVRINGGDVQAVLGSA